jgi:hypothetical protein
MDEFDVNWELDPVSAYETLWAKHGIEPESSWIQSYIMPYLSEESDDLAMKIYDTWTAPSNSMAGFKPRVREFILDIRNASSVKEKIYYIRALTMLMYGRDHVEYNRLDIAAVHFFNRLISDVMGTKVQLPYVPEFNEKTFEPLPESEILIKYGFGISLDDKNQCVMSIATEYGVYAYAEYLLSIGMTHERAIVCLNEWIDKLKS